MRDGYEVYPVVDAVGGTSMEAHRTALWRIVQAGAKPTSWVQIICELLRDSNRRETVQPFKQVLTPERLRTVTEPVIDGLGSWLHGETPVPRFSIDTGAIRSDLNRAVADYTAERLATLPVCPGTTDFSDYSPVTATCRPPREPSESELLGWTDEFTSQIPLLSKDTVSDADVVKDPGDRAWRLIPSTYWWVRTTLCVVAGLVVLTTALVLIAGRKRDRTLQTLGHALLIPAALFLVGGALIAAFSGFFTYDLASADTQIRSDFATETVLPLFQTLVRGVALWGMLFGAIFAVLATTAYVASRQLRRRGTQDRITTPGWLPPDQGVTR